jgi:hypothetical protein
MYNFNIKTGNQLDEKELQHNYSVFIDFIKSAFTGERREKLLAFYDEEEIATKMALAPASQKLNYHRANVGGYIQHVLGVVKGAQAYQMLWEMMGGTVDFTDEERDFAALHHDLGKIGDDTGPYYIDQDSEWHQKKRAEMFKHNPDIQFMHVPERALFMLQSRGIAVTQKEWLAIMLSDGMYSETARSYYMNNTPAFQLKTNLPYIVHGGDFLACRTEYDTWARENPELRERIIRGQDA